jgi:hypothetical protein
MPRSSSSVDFGRLASLFTKYNDVCVIETSKLGTLMRDMTVEKIVIYVIIFLN